MSLRVWIWVWVWVGSNWFNKIIGSRVWSVGPSRISDHLVLNHFGFGVILIRSGWVSDHIVLGYFGFYVVSDWIESDIGSSIVRLFLISSLIIFLCLSRIYLVIDINYDIYIFSHILSLRMVIAAYSYFLKQHHI
jgi:hypothetical protein